MPAAGVVMIVAVVLIVAAVVVYLLGTIMALRKITAGLDEAIAGVVGIIEKSAPVEEVVNDINHNLDAGVDLLEGLLVKKAGLQDAVGLIDGLYPGAAAAGLAQLPRQHEGQGAADRRGLHQGDADPGPAGPRGADRRRLAQRPGAAQPGLREPGAARTLYPECARRGRELMPRSPVIGDRLAGAVRPRRRGGRPAQADAGPRRKGAERPCRHPHRSVRARDQRRRRDRLAGRGSAPTPASSPAATGCCR